MTGLPSTIISTTFALTSQIRMDVTDDSRTGGAAVYVNSANATRYFRIFACAAGDATASAAVDEANAAEFLDHVERRLNVITPALWTVALDTDGRVKITYNGDGTPNGAIVWDGTGSTSTVTRDILGFTANISGLGNGQSSKATYQPCWAFFTNSRANDTNWRRVAPPAALANFGDGSTYGYISDTRRVERTFDCLGHPRTPTLQSSLDIWITPIESGIAARYLGVPSSPQDTSVSPAPPWDAWAWIDTSAGVLLGACLGNLQSAIAGTTTTYDKVQLTSESHSSIDTTPVQANHGGKDTIKQITLSLVSKSTAL